MAAPLTGKAMSLAGDTVFVAGAPLVFNLDDLAATYEGRRGGVLWAASADDGSKRAEYKLDALPAWSVVVSHDHAALLESGIEAWTASAP